MNDSYVAQRVSGVSGSLYALSMILEVVEWHNVRHLFSFPFYGLTFDGTNHAEEWVREDEQHAECDRLFNHIKKNGLEYLEDIRTRIHQDSEEFAVYVRESTKYLHKMSDHELVEAYGSFMSKYSYVYSLGAITFLYEHDFSKRLSESLAKRYASISEVIGEVLQTGYKSFVFEQEQLLSKVKNNKKLAKNYIEKFFFIKSTYSDSIVLTEKMVINDSKNVTKSKKQASHKKHPKLLEDEELLVEILKVTEVIHDVRKNINLVGSYGMFRFLDELVKRTGVDREIAKNMFWFEFKDFFADKKAILSRISTRTCASVVLNERNTSYVSYIAITEQTMDVNATVLRGTPASKGKVSGCVKIINHTIDFLKFKKGMILVTQMTRPEFLPIMKLAKAIITDEGSLTSHAAIVARELEIPCVVGTKSATRILKDGDMISVDANIGTITKTLPS